MLSGWQTESAVCISHPNGKKKTRSAGFKRRDGQQRAGGSFPKPGGRGYENQTLHKTL